MTLNPQAATQKGARKSDFPTMVWHTLLLFFIGLSIATGLRVAYDNAKGGWRQVLEPIMLQGDVLRWHAWAALALTGLVAGYLAFLWRAKLSARWKVSKVLMQSPNKPARWQAINRLLYWLGLACFVVTVLTGIWLYFLPFLGFMSLIALIHEISTWLLVLYMLLHTVAQFMLGGIRQLIKVFNPRFDYLQAGLAMTVAFAAGTLAFLGMDRLAIRDFQLVTATQAPAVDGRIDEEVWQKAPKVVVNTAHGYNVLDADTPVHVRGAVHGDRVYFLVEWPDTTESYMRLPLKKTKDGWIRLKGDYDKADTIDYYEDKFAIALSPKNSPFAGSWHFGEDPLPGYPKPMQGRGYHATLDGSYVDLWHWKASRTGPLGQSEDSHFGPAVKIDPTKKRYPAGYGSDPKTGGYKDNFVKKDGKIYPKYLPKDPKATFARLGGPALTPNDSHPSHYSMFIEDTVPYQPELDDYPEGTLLPSLLLESKLQGDGGDVDTVGTWSNGWWHLEFSRKFDTQQKRDVAIQDGIYLWFAAFNHNQTRHSWHVLPVRLRLPQ